MVVQPEEILNKLLIQIATEQNYVNFNIKIEPFDSHGSNYSTTLYKVTLTENENVIHMFGKVAAMGEQMRLQTPKVYEIEIFAYTKLAKVYEKLQNEHQISDEHRLKFCKFYGCSPTLYEETIVLEDLVVKGYQAHYRLKSFAWEYAKSAVGELAKMHALSFAYDEYDSEEFNKTVNAFKFDWGSKEVMMAYFHMMRDKAVVATREETRSKLKKFFEKFSLDKFVGYYKFTRRQVLAHGDYRASNLLHKIRDVS